MKKYLRILSFYMLIFSAFELSAQNAPGNPVKIKWKVGDVVREALVYIPKTAKTQAAPVVFAFHGHGGNMLNTYKRFGIHEYWPEAIFVCPQGLNTPGTLTDKEGKRSGWQADSGKMGDRDLQFFDVMLSYFKKEFTVDEERVYATGHSNGGGFTYLLWAERGDVFAAMAPSGAAAFRLTASLQPKPAFHLMGEKDPLVKPALQRLTFNAVLRKNQCTAEGKKIGDFTTWYESKTGNPVVLYTHPGGHELPEQAGKAIVDFFKKSITPAR